MQCGVVSNARFAVVSRYGCDNLGVHSIPEILMKRISLVVALSLFAASPVFAEACKAVSADGKPLSGAAKTSAMTKCCEGNAKSADGKPLSGAAKDASIKKCLAS